MDVRKALILPLGVLLLAGCTGDGSASPAPTTLPSLSATPSAVPSAPALPPEATPDTPQAAGAFARHYFAQLDWAYANSSVSALSPLHHPECDTCANFERAAAEASSRGERLVGGERTVTSAEASVNQPGDYLVDVFYDRAASRVLTAEGETGAQAAAESRIFVQLRVLHVGDGFIVRGIRFPEVPE